MKRILNTLVFVLLSLVALVATVLLWPFAVTALMAVMLSGMKFNRLISSALAFVLTVVWRITTGSWMVRIGDPTVEYWYHEVMSGLLIPFN